MINRNCLLLLIGLTCALPAASAQNDVVFIHPDGTGLGHWNALRLISAGPDGMTHWDSLNRLGAYRTHQKNWLSTSSHAGATVHAYGKKVHHNSYGLDRDQPLTALSGKPMTLMEEAMASGIRVGVVNSGHIAEPGTGVFLSRSESRGAYQAIAEKILESGADLIFCGGEVYLLPEGITGHHGEKGRRTDGRNLLAEAAGRGYTVLYTREELLNLDPSTDKVIGIFAALNTYNDKREEELRKLGLETYNPGQATFDEMVRMALKVLGSDPGKPFFLVAEEEGTDNFSNKQNAKGMLDAIQHADRAIGEVLAFMEARPERPLTLVVGADSDAGHPAIWTPRGVPEDFEMPKTTGTGAELDGPDGQGGRPFWSQPDAYGNRHPFGIAWAVGDDIPGSAVTKAHGHLSERLGASVDNTDIYKILYESLFGTTPWTDSGKE